MKPENHECESADLPPPAEKPKLPTKRSPMQPPSGNQPNPDHTRKIPHDP